MPCSTIEATPVAVWCKTCGVETRVAANGLLCGRCGTWQVRIVIGRRTRAEAGRTRGRDGGCGRKGRDRCARIADARRPAALSHDRGTAVQPLGPIRESIEVLTRILAENDRVAAHNREHLQAHGVLAVNLMSSPGSGKTSLLEATIDALGGRHGIAVIEGDLETENDAQRIRAKGVPAVQITTGQPCHLDAHMVHDALHGLDLSRYRHPVHRECRQSRLPGELRSRPACQRDAAVGDRRRRQAGQISGDVPRRRSGAVVQGRSARRAGRFRRPRRRRAMSGAGQSAPSDAGLGASAGNACAVDRLAGARACRVRAAAASGSPHANTSTTIITRRIER